MAQKDGRLSVYAVVRGAAALGLFVGAVLGLCINHHPSAGFVLQWLGGAALGGALVGWWAWDVMRRG